LKQGLSSNCCLLAITVLMLLSGCASAPYDLAPLNVDSLRQRAEVQNFEPLVVKAAVPGAREAESLFGVPLYDHGIQPVWLEISNRGEENVRFSMVSVDRDYFSPHEVSYTLKKGFSKEARAAMDVRFHGSGIERFVNPGETISGFVFTHLSPGTKSFNVDLFGLTTMQNFAFFIEVPGFLPDHSEVAFDELYKREEIRDLDSDEFRTVLNDLPEYTSDETGQSSGLPINMVVVAEGIDVLRALLRAGWYESAAGSSTGRTSKQTDYHLFGRKADATFRIQRNNSEDRNELRLWLAPMRVDGEAVWLAQASNFVGQRSYIEKVFFDAHLDPDVDDARSFTLQNIWYSQGLQAFTFVQSAQPIPFDQPRTDFNGNKFFSNGYRTVMWLSGTPYSLLDTTRLVWDEETR